MNQFSISQLAQFSGIKAHTIRIWEQRYNALQPQRSEGNTRYYDGSQLRRLLNIVSLSKAEYKVSKLCAMTDDQLFELLKVRYESASQESDYEYFINQFISSGITYDEYSFDKAFSHCLLKFGIEKTYTRIIYPMLDRIGLMWTTNKMPPSQEHYLSNLLKQKLFTAIDAMPPAKEGAETWLLFLPENEFHEIGLLFANYLLRSSGKRVIYLGTNVPLSSVENSIPEAAIDKLLLFLVHHDLPENLGEYISQLLSVGQTKKVYIAADASLVQKIPKKTPFHWITSVSDFQQELSHNSQTEV